jgi:hypothetical protein
MEQSLRAQVRQRAGGICEYCHMPEDCDELDFQVDHIIARKHHGHDDLDNLAWACFACNNHKSSDLAGRDFVTGDIVRLFNPRQDSWDEHFRWDGSELLGMTPIGRVTVDVLAINLWYRRVLRESLMAEGVFPNR